MLQGAEIIFNPNSCGGMKPRLKELSVRAMENMVGVAMANPPAEGMGRSCAFSPMVWGENGEVLDNTMIVAEEYYEGIVYANLIWTRLEIVVKEKIWENFGSQRLIRIGEAIEIDSE